jgi:hypothetical protein
MKAPPRTQGIIAAGLMAILTLSVFASLPYSGPESSIYRFHLGVVSRDMDVVKDACLQDPTSGPARELLAQVEVLLANSQDVRINRVQRKGRAAVVEVVYLTRQFGPVVIPFYMEKPVGRWLVDADRTWGLAARAPIGKG